LNKVPGAGYAATPGNHIANFLGGGISSIDTKFSQPLPKKFISLNSSHIGGGEPLGESNASKYSNLLSLYSNSDVSMGIKTSSHLNSKKNLKSEVKSSSSSLHRGD
jgi:hypothetical protein